MDRANVPPVDGESVWRRPTPGERLSLDLVPKSWLIACCLSAEQRSAIPEATAINQALFSRRDNKWKVQYVVEELSHVFGQ